MGSRARTLYTYLKIKDMNKNVAIVYERVLAIVLDDFGLTAEKMFGTNDPDCVNARVSLIIALRDEGLTDREIAECTHKMRRCSICQIRNRYSDKTANWEVKTCIAHIKKLKGSPISS